MRGWVDQVDDFFPVKAAAIHPHERLRDRRRCRPLLDPARAVPAARLVRFWQLRKLPRDDDLLIAALEQFPRPALLRVPPPELVRAGCRDLLAGHGASLAIGDDSGASCRGDACRTGVSPAALAARPGGRLQAGSTRAQAIRRLALAARSSSEQRLAGFAPRNACYLRGLSR